MRCRASSHSGNRHLSTTSTELFFRILRVTMRDQELQPIPVIDRQPYAIQAARAEEGMTLGDILQSLLRHRWFIAACAAASVALSRLYLKLKPPVYEASAVVRIDPERADTLAISDRPATMPAEPG